MIFVRTKFLPSSRVVKELRLMPKKLKREDSLIQLIIDKDESEILVVESKNQTITFTRQSIYIRNNEISSSSNDVISRLHVEEIIGSRIIEPSSVEIFMYKNQEASCTSSATLKRSSLILSSIGNSQKAKEISYLIIRLSQNIENATIISINPPRRRNFLVYVNPISGVGKSPEIWSTAQRMFDEANIDYTMYCTTRIYDCQDNVRDRDDLHTFEAILTIGGDGILLETLNGIMDRKDFAKICTNISLYPLPGGTGNGLSKSLLFLGSIPSTPIHATFLAIKGKTSRLDVATYETQEGGGGGKRSYSFLELIWGLPADVDIESEGLRFLGPLRFDVYGLMRIFNLRRYSGKLSYLPASHGEIPPFYWDSHSTRETKIKNDICPKFRDDVPSNWLTLDSNDWILFWAMNVTHASGKDYVAPSASPDDGYYHIVILRNVGTFPYCKLLDMFLKLESGSHVKNPNVEVIKTRAFRLEPQRLYDSRGGGGGGGCILDVDGEVIPYGKVQFEVLRGLIKTFVP